ncbi:prepilin-type N-terminal cleavage/methylation domain-containing protein [Candidatus Daviesbacteria bacterium]|nr:prepilin-type N-terminal cleavage/methylation domain-containing protein [Candidatus Daviesbacteria bacterium]
MKKHSRFSDGFTLAEMLVVISVLSVFGVILAVIFSRTIGGSSKAQILEVIKQNGQSVLETMDKTVRNGDNIVCPDPGILSSTLVVVRDGAYTRFRFITPTPDSNGYITMDNPVVYSPTMCGDVLINPVVVTDNTLDVKGKTGVSVSGGNFEVDRKSGFSDIITIKFVIGPGVEVPTNLSSQIDPVSFQTTIQLR